MNEILSLFKFGVLLIALILGLSCVVMAIISDKSGQEVMRERVEYGFMGIAGLAIAGLMGYALS